MKRIACYAPALLLAGCCSLPVEVTQRNAAPLNEVVTRLKDEILAFHKAAPKTDIDINVGCKLDVAKITPTAFKLTLKTVALTKNEPGAGLAAPFGIFKFDPSVGGSYSNATTITTTLPLSINVTTPPKIDAKDFDRAKVETLRSTNPIAYALWSFREELLNVKHEKPCFDSSKDKPMSVELAFDIVDTTTGGFAFTLAGFKAQNKATSTGEYHQTIAFDIAGGTIVTLGLPNQGADK